MQNKNIFAVTTGILNLFKVLKVNLLYGAHESYLCILLFFVCVIEK